jgi:hypothetical protein
VGKIVEGARAVAGGVLNRSADKAGVGGKPEGFGHTGGIVGEAFFQIAGDGHVDCVGDGAGMGERFITRGAAVAAAEHEGARQTRRRECGEAECGKDTRGRDVPGIGDDEGSRAFVQGAEATTFFELSDAHERGSGARWRSFSGLRTM